MSTRNYGIYQQGAIFHHEDFDPAKVILAVSKNICDITLPENILCALRKNDFSIDIMNELCEILNIQFKSDAEMEDYSYISDEIISTCDLTEWFYDSPVLMGSDDVYACVFSDIEGEFVFDSDNGNANVDHCYMLSLKVPIAWQLDDYSGPRTKEDVLKSIREVADALLKDTIDWEQRLGELIGSSMT